jgi:hypothetical protein
MSAKTESREMRKKFKSKENDKMKNRKMNINLESVQSTGA